MPMQPYQWATDKSRMGLKLLEKMGWSEGKGLGAKEDGQVENIKPKRAGSEQEKISGVGAKAENDGGWEAPGQMASGFNDVLARLSGVGKAPEVQIASVDDSANTRKSEPAKKKNREGRGFYERKRSRKNVGGYTKEQLREIFGEMCAEEGGCAELGGHDENADADEDEATDEAKVEEVKATDGTEDVKEDEMEGEEVRRDEMESSKQTKKEKKEKTKKNKKKNKLVDKIKKSINKERKSKSKRKRSKMNVNAQLKTCE